MSHTFALEAQALWRILVVGLVLGAGLPALFAVGIRAAAAGRGGAVVEAGGDDRAHPAARALSILCFAVVVAVVVLGIVFIVATGFGKALSFEHVYPTVVAKS